MLIDQSIKETTIKDC